MDRGELAKLLHDVLENDDDSGGGGYLRQADAALAWFRDYLGRDDVVERAAEAMTPLVNDGMCGTMRKAWTTDLARAALNAIGGKDGR